jgi:hypothetical protein
VVNVLERSDVRIDERGRGRMIAEALVMSGNAG